MFRALVGVLFCAIGAAAPLVFGLAGKKNGPVAPNYMAIADGTVRAAGSETQCFVHDIPEKQARALAQTLYEALGSWQRDGASGSAPDATCVNAPWTPNSILAFDAPLLPTYMHKFFDAVTHPQYDTQWGVDISAITAASVVSDYLQWLKIDELYELIDNTGAEWLQGPPGADGVDGVDGADGGVVYEESPKAPCICKIAPGEEGACPSDQYILWRPMHVSECDPFDTNTICDGVSAGIVYRCQYLPNFPDQPRVWLAETEHEYHGRGYGPCRGNALPESAADVLEGNQDGDAGCIIESLEQGAKKEDVRYGTLYQPCDAWIVRASMEMSIDTEKDGYCDSVNEFVCCDTSSRDNYVALELYTSKGGIRPDSFGATGLDVHPILTPIRRAWTHAFAHDPAFTTSVPLFVRGGYWRFGMKNNCEQINDPHVHGTVYYRCAIRDA